MKPSVRWMYPAAVGIVLVACTAAQEQEPPRDIGSDSLARTALSNAYIWTNRLDLAQREVEIAIDLNPNNAGAYASLGHILGVIGKTDEGVRNSKLALLLNPIDPRNTIFMVHIAISYLIAGDYQSAATWADDAIQRSAAFAEAHFLRAVALGHLGQAADARAALTECEKLMPDFVAQFHVSRPYLNRAMIDGFLDGLRKAGWEG